MTKNKYILELLILINKFDLYLSDFYGDHFVDTVARDIIIRNINSIQKQIKKL